MGNNTCRYCGGTSMYCDNDFCIKQSVGYKPRILIPTEEERYYQNYESRNRDNDDDKNDNDNKPGWWSWTYLYYSILLSLVCGNILPLIIYLMLVFLS